MKIYERILNVATRQWQVGIIEDHQARSLTEEELEAAIVKLNISTAPGEGVRYPVELRCAELEEALKELTEACDKLPASDARVIGLIPILTRSHAALADLPEAHAEAGDWWPCPDCGQKMRPDLGYFGDTLGMTCPACTRTTIITRKAWLAFPSLTPPSPAATEGLRECTWAEDYDGVWSTSCHNIFEFTDGGPAENHATYCIYCGLPINAEKYQEMYEDDPLAPDAALRGEERRNDPT